MTAATSIEQERVERATLSCAEAGVPEPDRFNRGNGPVLALRSRFSKEERLSLNADAERALIEAERQGIRFVIPGDDEWPTHLNLMHPLGAASGTPWGLWVRGNGHLFALTRRGVAVVGSRAATTYGTGVAADLSGALTEADFTIVSGAAFGIDQAAHRGALAAGGPTVAVLSCGVDRAYPLAHAHLLDYIAERGGCVVSETPPGLAPSRSRFLARNRIVSGLSRAVVVVEGAERSGVSSTVNHAHAQGRPVAAVPGPVTSAASHLPNRLIADGKARLVTGSADVIRLIEEGW